MSFQKAASFESKGPQGLLNLWAQERALRVGRSLFSASVVLALVALIADLIWSDRWVIGTDVIMLTACSLSCVWSHAASRPRYFWWPGYWAFWLSMLPSLWSTGGIYSPFFGIDMAAIYTIGSILETRQRSSYYYLGFAIAHIPVFWAIQAFHPLPEMNFWPAFTGIIMAATLLAIFICINALLNNERELANEFAEHYRRIAKTESELHESERMSEAKMQFLANMSHEIRTPMNSILGFSDLLAGTELSSDDAREAINLIRANGQQLLHLIDDILDLSKFEAGRIPIHKTPLSMLELFDEVIHSFEPTLKAKNLALQLEYGSNLSRRCHGDLHRIKQILINLLSNAIKFSSQGIIKVTVGCETLDTVKAVNLRVDIYDSGIGIAAEHHTKLFQPFSQADNSVSRKFGGNGLGLALSRRIAEAMGGKLELVSSEVGKGSQFAFVIPMELAVDEDGTLAATSRSPLTNLKDKRILLVEDSSDNALLIKRYIQDSVGQLDFATDGETAVTAVNNGDYDCILMDIQIPGIDGHEATRQIRQHGFNKPIIALTAHALPTEAARSAEAGCTVHLTKPISRTELIGTLSQCLQ